MRIAHWVPKARNTHSEYVIVIAFPLQQWLNERVSLLRHNALPVLLFIYNYINKSVLFLCDDFYFCSSNYCRFTLMPLWSVGINP